jgi:predicted acylesterase/phospholipase RssA
VNYKMLTHSQYASMKVIVTHILHFFVPLDSVEEQDRQRRKAASSHAVSSALDLQESPGCPAPIQPYQRPLPVSHSQHFWTKESVGRALVTPAERKFRILALDGGGVRGVLSSTILHRIVQQFPSFLDSVDLVTGSSTGGILSLLLAYGYTPLQCKAIYESHCPEIFVSNTLRRYSLFSAAYSDAPKLQMLKRYFGPSQLSDLSKYLMITSFRLDGETPSPRKSFFGNVRSWRPALISNFPRLQGPVDPDDSLTCVDAAMMTSAAPTYFPAHRIQGVGPCYIDGGVFANNPSHMAVTKIQVPPYRPSIVLARSSLHVCRLILDLAFLPQIFLCCRSAAEVFISTYTQKRRIPWTGG